MYIRSLKFKISKNAEWQCGYYVGDGENSNCSCILDTNYQPVLGEIWDLTYTNNLVINVPEVVYEP